VLDVIIEVDAPAPKEADVAPREHAAPRAIDLQIHLAQIDIGYERLVALLRDVAPNRKAPTQRVVLVDLAMQAPPQEVGDEARAEARVGDLAVCGGPVVEALPVRV